MERLAQWWRAPVRFGNVINHLAFSPAAAAWRRRVQPASGQNSKNGKRAPPFTYIRRGLPDARDIEISRGADYSFGFTAVEVSGNRDDGYSNFCLVPYAPME
jgi:hypothetical protein